jgi:hypothetical protein
MRLERHLILNRYFHSLLNAGSLEDLKQCLKSAQEGISGDGQSWFLRELEARVEDQELQNRLRAYDTRVMGYEARLARARGAFSFKYFQYLSLLYVEMYLDFLTENPENFATNLNAFLQERKVEEAGFGDFSPFSPDELRRLAFFMATGSGKTLLLHVNLWQVFYYLENGRHPEALVRRSDDRYEFDNVLLITPNEGLSHQHLQEFELSGIDAALLVHDRDGRGLFGPKVKVIDIYKLAEEPSKEGISILLDELGNTNLVFVDEGHKGVGAEAQIFKNRQKRLSVNGLLLEYSATFAQAVGAASQRAQKDLIAEYGKCILFDYSYRHFYEDGYGKDFQVLNIARAREDQAFELLVGGLLTYYEQFYTFREKENLLRPYNVERPLWIFLGSSVNAVYSRGGQKRSDVATVVSFLKRFLEDPSWAIGTIRRILEGKSGFVDAETREDLFAGSIKTVAGMAAEDLYSRMAREVFQGPGGLEIWELKSAEGELALRVSTPEGGDCPYFGVINIGDVSAFKKHLEESLQMEVREDRFTPSLFQAVNSPDSPVNVLLGSKKFIEGWSSWRVSAMGLLNMGKGEGSQVIQLFGRGVRLKGKKWSLKRSSALPEEGPHPEGLDRLERLHIFGWNADYVQAFRKMIAEEDLGREVRIPVRIQYRLWPRLPVPRPRRNYRVGDETWLLEKEPLRVEIDLTPKVAALVGVDVVSAIAEKRKPVDFCDPALVGLLDMDGLFVDLVQYKEARGHGNVFIRRGELLPILQASELFLAENDAGNPAVLQEGASRVLRTYLDRFVAAKEREAEGSHMEPIPLSVVSESVIPYYTVRVPSSAENLLQDLEDLIKKPSKLYQDGGKPLPRLHVEEHLFSPLLVSPESYGIEGVSVVPPGLRKEETEFLQELHAFWKHNHEKEPYKTLEVYVLRNLPRVGVGFFRKSGFYPDFVLWIKDRGAKSTHILFIEPHGLHHGGLSGNRDKMAALEELRTISREKVFQKKRITMDGRILTKTKLKHIADAGNRTWADIESEFPVLRQEGPYIQKILGGDRV